MLNFRLKLSSKKTWIYADCCDIVCVELTTHT
uniref:Uncharacterized protein n=1 Tax=Arundo donax TaxID=35708 RepID=A0A0A8ZX16_ARUDO